MQGKIVKGIAGFYYVDVENLGIVECKAKGSFRNKKIKPLVGDNAEVDILDEEKLLGNIVDILPRSNSLIRPEVANIDQALVVFAVNSPVPNLNMLARFLIMMRYQEVDTIICFNKTDIASEEEKEQLREIFANSHNKLVFASTYDESGMNEIRELIKGKTTVLAGPSGVGKSSLINKILPEANMQTGDISEKIKRGKHTTRHSELFSLGNNTYIMDTPGFTSLYVNNFMAEDIRMYFGEFDDYEGKCRFNGCVHVNEPDCAVKKAVSEGKISKVRYENYLEIYKELKNIKRF